MRTIRYLPREARQTGASSGGLRRSNKPAMRWFVFGLLASLGMAAPLSAAAETGAAESPPGSLVLELPRLEPGKGVYLIATVRGPLSSGTTWPLVTVYIDDKKAATQVPDATGTARLGVKLPSVAGKHSIKVVAGDQFLTRTFTLGTAVNAKLAKPKAACSTRTETIAGSFGHKAGKITLKITDPQGKAVTKTVTLNSKGKFSYKYTAAKKGSYTVRYSYLPNTKYYGTKSYKLSFMVR